MGTLARLPVLFAVALLAPAAAYGQASIVGTVRDPSGAVLPGVTVEAASPALIEKLRVAVTDGTGQYRIENLRPGVFVVTFTLPGFSTVRREGIELTGTFVATVNAELRIGALTETITVTGETPIVDVQSTSVQRVLNQEVLEVLPSSRAVAFITGLTPGVTMTNQDVGGVIGDGVGTGGLRVRGVGDSRLLIGGVVGNTTYRIAHGAYNLAAYQEVVVDTGGTGAEQEEGGVRINLIPRDGGNVFSGFLLAAFANRSMEGSNFTPALRDRGLRTPDSIKQLLDINPSFGGPIKRDKVWFHTTVRYARAWNFTSVFFNKHAGDPTVWTYEPDLSRGPAWTENTIENFSARVTWQATSVHKFAGTYDPSDVCDCPRNLDGRASPEAVVTNYLTTKPNRNISAEWTAPLTSRFLLESHVHSRHSVAARARVNPFFAPGPVPLVKVTEQSTAFSYRGTPNARVSENKLLFWRTVASYITGAHALKVGFIYGRIPNDDYTFTLDAPIEYRFRNGVPNQLTLHATPFRQVTDLDADHGLFVQDRWTVRRLTLTGGLRYTFLRIRFPEEHVGPGEWAPNRNIVIPKTDGAVFHDLSPRIGAAYDLFGTGRTALKVSLNHYPAAQDRSTIFGADMSPVGRLITRTDRSWNDANRNFVPDCDLVNPAANGECGAMANRAFGSTRPGRAFDRDASRGFGKRYYNWQFSAGIQQEILPRVSLDVNYWRTWFGNFAVITDRALTAADFDEFSITAPLDPRLPGGGGYVLSGLYDLKPAKFGVPADEFVTFADPIGKQTDHWNGVDVTVNARPRPGVLLQGGTSTQRRTTDNCAIAAQLPQIGIAGTTIASGAVTSRVSASVPRQFCHVQGTFLTQLKILGAYTVPRIDVQLSVSLQNLPGPEIAANYVVSNAEVRRSLGRDLAGAARNVTVNLVEPRSMYGERTNQLDVRIGKILRFGRTRATASLDVYNALNASSVLRQSDAFATWQRPEAILEARFAKVVLQVDF